MNEQLIKFIELCLADGVITDKEREVIFRKAKKLGVDEDECEILIDSFAQKSNKVSLNKTQTPSRHKRNFTQKKAINLPPAELNKALPHQANAKTKLKGLKDKHNLLVEELKNVEKKLDILKKLNESDFNSYVKDHEEDKKQIANLYIKTLEDDIVSKKTTKYHVIMRISKTNKTRISNIILEDINTIVEYTLRSIKWNIYPTEETIKKDKKSAKIFGLTFIILSFLFFFVFDFDSGISIFFEIVFGIIGLLSLFGNLNETLDNDIKNAKSIRQYNNGKSGGLHRDLDQTFFSDILNRVREKEIDELLKRKKMIDEVKAFQSTVIKIPKKIHTN